MPSRRLPREVFVELRHNNIRAGRGAAEREQMKTPRVTKTTFLSDMIDSDA
jgi:hypothetical protein